MLPYDDVWQRVRRLGRLVEDELYDFTEEDEREEPRGRNTIVALLNTFMTIWKANEANVGERTFGLLGFGGLTWLVLGDRGMDVRRTTPRTIALTFATLWFLPGLFAAAWTVTQNMGWISLRQWRTFPLMLSFGAGGLITFRAVFGDLTRPRRVLINPRPRRKPTGRKGMSK